MNRRNFLKRFAQLCGLPALAAIIPLPAVLNAAGIRRAKKVLDAQSVYGSGPILFDYAKVAKTFVWTTQFGFFAEIGPGWLLAVSGRMPDGLDYTAAEYVREEEDFNYARVALENAMQRRYNSIVEEEI